MTQDEVLAALHNVVAENMNFTTWTVSTPHLVALVNLAVEQEREACAKLCDEASDIALVLQSSSADDLSSVFLRHQTLAHQNDAAAIRARTEEQK